MTDRQKANALITYFINKYEEKHGDKPVVNRFKEKWNFLDLLEDYGYDEVKELIDYHFSLDRPDDSIKEFLGSSGILATGMRQSAQQKLNTETLLRETQERLRAWQTEKSKS
jgi:hypothetical protein